MSRITPGQVLAAILAIYGVIVFLFSSYILIDPDGARAVLDKYILPP